MACRAGARLVGCPRACTGARRLCGDCAAIAAGRRRPWASAGNARPRPLAGECQALAGSPPPPHHGRHGRDADRPREHLHSIAVVSLWAGAGEPAYRVGAPVVGYPRACTGARRLCGHCAVNRGGRRRPWRSRGIPTAKAARGECQALRFPTTHLNGRHGRDADRPRGPATRIAVVSLCRPARANLAYRVGAPVVGIAQGYCRCAGTLRAPRQDRRRPWASAGIRGQGRSLESAKPLRAPHHHLTTVGMVRVADPPREKRPPQHRRGQPMSPARANLAYRVRALRVPAVSAGARAFCGHQDNRRRPWASAAEAARWGECQALAGSPTTTPPRSARETHAPAARARAHPRRRQLVSAGVASIAFGRSWPTTPRIHAVEHTVPAAAPGSPPAIRRQPTASILLAGSRPGSPAFVPRGLRAPRRQCHARASGSPIPTHGGASEGVPAGMWAAAGVDDGVGASANGADALPMAAWPARTMATSAGRTRGKADMMALLRLTLRVRLLSAGAGRALHRRHVVWPQRANLAAWHMPTAPSPKVHGKPGATPRTNQTRACAQSDSPAPSAAGRSELYPRCIRDVPRFPACDARDGARGQAIQPAHGRRPCWSGLRCIRASPHPRRTRRRPPRAIRSSAGAVRCGADRIRDAMPPHRKTSLHRAHVRP